MKNVTTVQTRALERLHVTCSDDYRRFQISVSDRDGDIAVMELNQEELSTLAIVLSEYI